MKNKGKIILAVIVCLAVVVGATWGILHWRNSENEIEIPAVTERTPNETIFVSHFTDMRVTDSNSAIVAVLDYLELTDTDMFFQLQSESRMSNTAYIRLAQYYRGIPVWGRNVVVVASDSGNTLDLSGNPIEFSGVSTIPTLSEENALARARELFGGNLNARNVGMVIYSLGVDPLLCYKIDIIGMADDGLPARTLFICANSGDVISSRGSLRDVNANSTRRVVGQDSHIVGGAFYDLPYYNIDGEAVMFCNQRNIAVYSFSFDNARHDLMMLVDMFPNGFNSDIAIRLHEDSQRNNKSAIDAFGNTIVVYDFFANHLSWRQFNNNPDTHLPIVVDILTSDSRRNAFFWKAAELPGMIGFEMPGHVMFDMQLSANLDIVAHEFVHGVCWFTWAPPRNFTDNELESATLLEAIADIFGEIIEHYHTGENDWKIAGGYIRDFRDGRGMAFSTNRNAHDNSVIISYIAYVIADAFPFSEEEQLITYAELWHSVQRRLPSIPTFEDFANTTVVQARHMLGERQITELQYQAVRNAFIQNGIMPSVGDVGQAPTVGGEGALQQQGNEGATTGTTFTITPMVSAGGGHTIALHSDGTVWAWGDNASGQLGIGSSGRDMFIPTPVRVPTLDNIKAISAGGFHSLVLHNDGTVWAFGSNGVGQLGNGAGGGSENISSVPVQVNFLNNIIAISAGSDYSLALRNDGTVWAWGSAYSGRLGHRSEGAISNRDTPIQIQGLHNITAVSAGNHTVALQNNDIVFALGNNRHGQLGNGSGGGFGDGNNYAPTQARNLNNVTAIEAGGTHTLALRNDGTVWVWGTLVFSHARLAEGSPNSGPGLRFHPNHLTPMQVPNVNNIIAITAGNQSSFVLRSDGTVWAWGWNSNGKLGDGTTIDRDTPVQVAGLNNAMAISTGSAHAVALRDDGTVWTWGANSRFGQLGDGTTTNRYAPTQVVGENGVGHFNVFTTP